MKFLYKAFIKDYQNVKDENVRQKYGLLAGTLGIIANLILVILKLIIGFLVNSVSLIGDALNNIGDTFSSFVNIFSFKINSKPADKKHPFGHRRSEYVGGLLIAFVIIMVAIELAGSSIDKIFHPTTTIINWYIWLVLAVNICIKIFMAILYRNSYKRINSIALHASYKDSLNDILMTVIIILGLYGSNILGFDIDGYLGIGLSVFVIISGINLIKEAIDKLLGEAVEEEIVSKVNNDILKYDDIIDIHDVLAHQYGEGKIFMSAHVEMDASLSLLHAHDIIDRIERAVREKYNLEILLHIDPIDFTDEELLKIKRTINNIVANYDSKLSTHDIRITRNRDKRIYFDLTLPYEYMHKAQNIVNDLAAIIVKQCGYKISIDINYQ